MRQSWEVHSGDQNNIVTWGGGAHMVVLRSTYNSVLGGPSAKIKPGPTPTQLVEPDLKPKPVALLGDAKAVMSWLYQLGEAVCQGFQSFCSIRVKPNHF